MKRKLQPHEKSFLKAVLLALVLFLLPLVYRQPDYDKLREKEVEIMHTSALKGRRGSYDYHLVTEDGTWFFVRGKVHSRDAFETELPGKTAFIKYNRGLLLVVPVYFLRELTMDGEVYVSYTDVGSAAMKIFHIAAVVDLVFSFLEYGDRSHLFKRWIKKYRKWKKEK